jgi:hypothetical protein
VNNLKRIEANLKARGAYGREVGEDGGRCVVDYKNVPLRIQYSWGLGWEHVSVSTPQRCPTWEEMCFVKDTFWPDDEWCVQYHPAKADYVNVNPYCLHIFRPAEADLPKPLKCMV